ncbi:MAG: mammalian cell entry protein [Rhodospirillales bacterium 20-64-7]|nr:MAG: mammalian cell entry protein [Rhodospirillales bacterium 20-64-7]
MDHKRAAFRVGLFTLAGIASLLALVFFLSGSALHPGIPFETYFQESVQGLDVGTEVKFRGVTIGKVTDVGLVTAEYPPANIKDENEKVYQLVVVRFRVDPKKLGHVDDIQQAVNRGLRVQIAPQGITGLAYVELSFVNPQQYPVTPVPWTPDSTVIPSMPSTLTQVQDAIENLMTSLSKVDAGKIVTQFSDLLASLDHEVTTGDAHQAIANANILLNNLNIAVSKADLPATSASIRNLAGGPQTTQILVQLNQTTAQLSKVSAELPALVAQSQATINQADETTADLQASLGPILQDLKTTTANLRELTDSLKHNPAQVLDGAAPPPEGDH